ncbi:MAG TPA: chorismate lyase [Gammaproteobacteria bacterium]|nr:chorismate lyase [Gammaproteobacteria bacterium]
MTDLRTRWQPIAQVNHNTIPPQLLDCLLHSGSLTRFLEYWCRGHLALHLNNQSWQKPILDEALALRLDSGRFAFVREINFTCDHVPWVYGRSILPAATISGSERRLAHWGQRSLGSYLFSGKNIRRGRIEVARLNAGSDLHDLVTAYHGETGTGVWARRSIFYIREKPLLVVEVFLDNLVQCITTAKK